MSCSLLSPLDVLKKGLGYVGIGRVQQARLSGEEQNNEFKAHYGSPPLVLAAIWYDLCHTTIELAHLEEKDKSESGFKRFMIAHFHLWTYPKNVCLLASRFNICKRYLQV
jgi:hypothetical protein